ncbi:MAG: adenylate/guanylate cyclase domain-containing protein [Gammaproteobacteria bacterium]
MSSLLSRRIQDVDLSAVQRAVAKVSGVTISVENARQLYDEILTLTPQVSIYPSNSSIHEVTVLLADLRGFTAISEIYPLDLIFEILNLYLVRMSEIAISYGGTIDKFMGDAIMIVFGAPIQSEQDVHQALTCAVQMQIAMNEINEDLKSRGLPAIYMGMGINTGIVRAGMVGSRLHSEYTVIGDEVNVASRIETFSLRGQVLISEKTYRLCDRYVAVGEPMQVQVKGKSNVVELREVIGIPSLGLELPRQDSRGCPRVETKLNFTYKLVKDKVVDPSAYSGTSIDISYQGMLAELSSDMAVHSDILLEIDLSLIGAQPQRIQAKIKSVRFDQGRCLAGIEFTAIGGDCERDIRRLVQLMIQGGSVK